VVFFSTLRGPKPRSSTFPLRGSKVGLFQYAERAKAPLFYLFLLRGSKAWLFQYAEEAKAPLFYLPAARKQGVALSVC
jgi:hypothetical protein